MYNKHLIILSTCKYIQFNDGFTSDFCSTFLHHFKTLAHDNRQFISIGRALDYESSDPGSKPGRFRSLPL